MKTIEKNISKNELRIMSQKMFGDFVKAVIDLEKGIMAVDAELHADLEAYLLKQGSSQENLWGINLYPDASDADFIEFDSMINIRPRQNNRSRDIEDQEIRKKIITVVNKLVD